jgi:aminoglycoside phosphotransferase (APT) family kinase protein
MQFGVPAADVDVTIQLVRDVLREQHADLAELPIEHVDTGWDNCMFRLGDALMVRFPRRQAAAELLVHEQTFLPVLAPRLSLPVPTPVRVGRPSALYPWSFSVVPWFRGSPVGGAGLPAQCAPVFARFLRELHQPAPDAAPRSLVRGLPLGQRATAIEARLTQLRLTTPYVTPHIDELWQRALATELASDASWLHGDLHALNVLVDAGQVSAVIDWGDLTAGDVATDLACAWTLFDTQAGRRTLLDSYAASETLRRRAMGWAVGFGAILLSAGLVNSPRLAEIGKATLVRLDADAGAAGRER